MFWLVTLAVLETVAVWVSVWSFRRGDSTSGYLGLMFVYFAPLLLLLAPDSPLKGVLSPLLEYAMFIVCLVGMVFTGGHMIWHVHRHRTR